MGKEEPHLRHSLYPSQVTTGSSSKHDMNIETPSGKHATRMKKLDSEKESKGKECMLPLSKLPKLSYTLGDGKWRNCSTKTLASRRVNNKSSYVDVIEISGNSGCGDVIEISGSSSCNSNRRKQRRHNPPEEGLPSRHIVHPNQESRFTSNLSLAKNPPLNHDLLLAVTRHPEVQPSSHVLSPSVALLESFQAPSNNYGEHLIPLPGYPVSGMQPLQGLAGMNEIKEPPLSDRAHSEAEFMAPDDSTARDENYETCQEVNEVKSRVADNCNEEADTGLITSKNSKQSIVDRSYGEANSMRQRSRDSKVLISRKLGPSSSAQQGVKADLSCMPVLNDSTISTLPLVRTSAFQLLSPKEMQVPEGHRKPLMLWR